MQIQCPSCKQPLSTDGSVPRFCSHCGSSLVDLTVGEGGTVSTDDTPPSEHDLDVTMALAPQTKGVLPNIDLTQDSSHGHGTGSGSLQPGSSVGPFKIVGVLGKGGMGTVYEAVHSVTGQTVALKLLSRSVRTTKETMQRFQRESQIAASINHPRSTFVYQAGQHLGQFYITMELMTGGTLTDVVEEQGSIPIDRAVDNILDIISGLQAAHQAGIVHRDLKPSNCFVEKNGRVKIGDFGLAKSFLSESSLTQTGTFMGTPQFAAPEQLRTSEVDERADIYAIGGTLFYLLAGRAPFIGNAAQVIASIASDQPPKISTLAENVPRELERVIHQTLEKDPARRPENLEELRQLLLPFSTRGSTAADPGRRMAAFFIDVVIIALLIAFIAQFMGMLVQAFPMSNFHQVFFFNIFVVFFVSVAYFAVQESRWGTTIGKWLLGMRVITRGNRTPGLFASIVRATLVVGLSYLANAIPAYAMNFDPQAFLESDSRIWTVVWLQVFQLLSWLPILLCFVTARKSNGFLGVHEILSGTRVVRLAGALEYKRPKNVPVTSPVAIETRVFGEFHAIGQLGHRPDVGSEVLLGRDAALDRDVWIINQPSIQHAEDWEKRKSVSRPSRLRIIAENGVVIENAPCEQRWVVTEAIKGMPLVDYVQQTPNVDWRTFRPLLRELVYELANGQADGTLPKRMNTQSVWVDQTGHAKLLDLPILPIGSSEDDSPWLTPLELTVAMLDEFIENQVAPAHVLRFREKLDALASESDPLRWIGGRLGEMADEPSAWSWDDRLGVLAVSSGVEFSTGASVVLVAGLIGAFIFKMTFPQITLLTLGGASLAAILLGFVFSGGPVFRISGVLVRKNKTLEPATRVRCAFRNWIAWLPLIAMATCLAVVVQQQLLAESQAHSDLETNQNMLFIGGLLAMLPLGLVVLTGLLYSLARPSRGLADVISGTRLIRR